MRTLTTPARPTGPVGSSATTPASSRRHPAQLELPVPRRGETPAGPACIELLQEEARSGRLLESEHLEQHDVALPLHVRAIAHPKPSCNRTLRTLSLADISKNVNGTTKCITDLYRRNFDRIVKPMWTWKAGGTCS